MPLLVVFKDDWADEFDGEGFFIFDNPQDWQDLKNKAHDNMELYFGTNEWFEYETPEQYLNQCTEHTITEELSVTLKGLFGLTGRWPEFGIFPTP